MEAFRAQHPETIWSVKRLDKKSTGQWRKVHSDAAVTIRGRAPPKRLWRVEVEDAGTEKLCLVISPTTKRLVEAQQIFVDPLAARLPNWNNTPMVMIMDTDQWALVIAESKTILPDAKLGRRLDVGECVECRKKSTFLVKGEAGLIFCANCGQKYQVIDSVTEEVLSFP